VQSATSVANKRIISGLGHRTLLTSVRFKIKEALPTIFEVAYPVIDPRTEMMSALSLLRFQEIDALPLSFETDRNHRAIAGASCLVRLLHLKTKDLQKFLKQPCVSASDRLPTVRSEQNLSVLLDTFLETRFGFARVVEKRRVGALARLRDFLGLYETGRLETDLLVEDVATPIFSLPGKTKVRAALEKMLEMHSRRVFISGTKSFVWDRGIIDRLFSPGVLARAARNPSRDFLGMPLSEFERLPAIEVKPGTRVNDLAGLIRLQRGQCFVSDGKVVTPWDVVMKPWKANALNIR